MPNDKLLTEAIQWWSDRFLRDPRKVQYLLRYNDLATPKPRENAKWIPYHAILFTVEKITPETALIPLKAQTNKCAWAEGLIIATTTSEGREFQYFTEEF